MESAAAIDGSLMDPLVQADPFDFYRQLHERAPVYRMPETGFYVVSTYEGVRAVVSDPETFSNHQPISRLAGDSSAHLGRMYNDYLSEIGYGHVETLHRTDPPAHTRYRQIMNRAFTPAIVKGMVPDIEQTSATLIDAFVDRGTCEFVADFAFPMPGLVFGHVLGLDPADIGLFRHWADALLATAQGRLVDEEAVRHYAQIEAEAQRYFVRVLEERRADPRDDLLSAFVAEPEDDGEPLTMPELLDLMHQMITGGYATTADAIANGMLLLIENPDQLALLRADRSLLRGFADEVLRRASSVQGLFRRATRDTELFGVPIPKDAVVHVRFGAANVDAAKFDDPLRFDITRRDASKQVAFSRGPHFCVGQPLAMQELMIAFDVLLDRLDDIRLAPDAEPIRTSGLLFYSLESLPITFSARR
jgi:cytochrome P450